MTAHALANQFHARFCGLERAHGVCTITDTEAKKVRGAMRTVAEPVTDDLWAAHLHGEQGLGIIPINDDAGCYWGAIDIDIYEGLDWAELEARVERHGLPLVLCRTKSGGIHAFVFLQRPKPAAEVQQALGAWSSLLGFPKSEIFPKQIKLADGQDTGNWLNMPYFGGNDTNRYCIRAGARLTPEEFLAWATERAVSELHSLAPVVDDLLTDAPPCIQYIAQKKLGANDGRNAAIFAMAIYCKRRWPDGWEPKVLAFNAKFFQSPLSIFEIQSTIFRSLKRKDYAYPCSKKPLSDGCNKTLCLKCGYGVASDDDPGVTLRNLRQVGTIFYLTVGEIEVTLPNVDTLRVQESFFSACMEQAHVHPKKVTGERWRTILNELLANIQVVEVPQEATGEGMIWDLIESLCSSHAKADAQQVLNGGVLVDEEGYYFPAKTVMSFLRDEGSRPERNVVWDVLRKHGSSVVTREICGAACSLWKIPRAQAIGREQKTGFANRVPDGDM